MREKDGKTYDQTKRRTDDCYFNNRRREREKRERNTHTPPKNIIGRHENNNGTGLSVFATS